MLILLRTHSQLAVRMCIHALILTEPRVIASVWAEVSQDVLSGRYGWSGVFAHANIYMSLHDTV